MNEVHVFGDAILDHDVYVTPNGSVSSEDKTALHLIRTGDVDSLGGAGRVASLLAKAGCEVKFFTHFGGFYEERFRLTAECAGLRLPLAQTPEHAPERAVTLKQRFWGGRPGRMLFRVDHDGQSRWTNVDTTRLQRHEPGHVLLVVDHNKGFCSYEMKKALINFSQSEARQQVLLVDPGNDNEARDYGSPYTVYKMNAKQAQRLAATVSPTKKIFDWDERQPDEVYYELLERVLPALKGSWAGVWLTLGPGGMLYRSAIHGHAPIRPKCDDREIIDTCGAGDAAMAWFAARITTNKLTECRTLYNLINEANEAAHAACTVRRTERK